VNGKRVRRIVGHIERVDLEVGGHRLAAWCKGRGEPAAVCVRGAGVSSRAWLPLVAELGCARQVWTVDLPGFGASRGLSRTLGLPTLTDAEVGVAAHGTAEHHRLPRRRPASGGRDVPGGAGHMVPSGHPRRSPISSMTSLTGAAQ
jgi:pimeloyl-ACP methyl ester carboxylesterase